MSFNNLYRHGFARLAACNFPITLANPQANADQIIAQAHQAADAGAAVAVWPELSVTGYSLDDLFTQDPLLDAAEAALLQVATETRDLPLVMIVGAPVLAGGALLNCAVVITGGAVVGINPKSYLPGYGEFYEPRHFTPATALAREPGWATWGRLGQQGCAFGPRTTYAVENLPGLVIYPEICEDMWVPVTPGSEAALAGATVIVNLSSSPATVGRARHRRLLVQSTSARCAAGYLYVAAGAGESSNDLAWDGQSLIYESGELLGEGPRFGSGPQITYGDIDLAGLARRRRQLGTFADNAADKNPDGGNYVQRWHQESLVLGVSSGPRSDWGVCGVTGPDLSAAEELGGVPGQAGFEAGLEATLVAREDRVRAAEAVLFAVPGQGIPLPQLAGELPLRYRPNPRRPFVPEDPERRDEDCWEAYQIQVSALAQRLRSIPGQPRAVIGVSGGLDSTHALLVCVQAMKALGRPVTEVLAFTMPGFATSDATKSNALELCRTLGVPCEVLDIRPAALQMLADLGHAYAQGQRGPEVYDVTFENVQAGLRTDYLFRLANQRGGIVIGTGDLSELALGWCTYGVGDQMSHYAVNAGVPKTLIQHLIRWVVRTQELAPGSGAVLESILETEISPELIPADAGARPQSTQATIGPYELHDYFLARLLGEGAGVEKTAFLAGSAFGALGISEAGGPSAEPKPGSTIPASEIYSMKEILAWQRVFYQRFFANQFKRTALPNGPKVLRLGALSPRGDWRMPADASAQEWTARLDALAAELGL